VVLFFSPFIRADDISINDCPCGILPIKSIVKTTILKHEKSKDSEGISSESKEYRNTLMNDPGKCYKVGSTKFVYLVDDKNAIYSVFIPSNIHLYIPPQLLLLNFAGSKWKKRAFKGIIKTSGEYFYYKDHEGIPRKIPKVTVVKEN
jgi:hypothetical protein